MNEILRRRRALMGGKAGTAHGTWEDLFRAINAGTYAAEYAVGEILPLDLGTEGVVNAQIVAFDADTIDGTTDKAPVTFVSQYCLATSKRMNPSRAGESGNWTEGTGAIGGWEKTELRAWLISDVLPLFPSNILNRMQIVKKVSYGILTSGSSSANMETADKIWVPCQREANVNTTQRETTGPIYSGVFTSDNNTRVKSKPGGSSVAWWWRSAGDSQTFRIPSISYKFATKAADQSAAIAVGFCIA